MLSIEFIERVFYLRKDDFDRSFGAFASDKSAEEIVADIKLNKVEHSKLKKLSSNALPQCLQANGNGTAGLLYI